jgi:uncharacterized membrane protein
MDLADSSLRSPLDLLKAALARLGLGLFALTFIGLGVEAAICARRIDHPLGPGYAGSPVLPWLPAIPWVGYVSGALWALCGAGLLTKKWLRPSAYLLGSAIALSTLIYVVPAYVELAGDMGLRTVVFEPLTLASIVLILPGETEPFWLGRICRWLIAAAMIVFGVDHFIGLTFIANLLPAWIPWHRFWVVFFGIVFITGGLSIGLNVLLRWGEAGIGLMFAIWVFTLHLPRVLGWYGIPGAPHDPDEWCSLLIAIGIWGGMWAMLGDDSPGLESEERLSEAAQKRI